MSDIATKLTYLSGTKDLLKTTINYTGANITNDTFRSYPKKLKDAYIDIINNGTDTLYSNLPKVSGKGSNLSLTPTYEAPMRSELYGDTYQDGTPTPSSPVEIENVTGLQTITIANGDNTSSNTYEVNLGKNLFDINGTFTENLIKYNNGFQLIKNSTNRTINYLPSSPISKGTYTLSYEIVSSTLSDVNKLSIQFFNANNTNVLSKTLSSTGSLNCILTEDVTKIYFYIANSEATDTQITLDNMQLEKGSSSSSYSPYFTPIELNKIGTYEDRIYKDSGKWYLEKNIGKVVLDGSNDENWGIWFSTTGVYYSANYISSLTDSASTINCICDKYQANTRTYLRNNLSTIDNVCAVNGGELILANKSITSTSDFKTWLSNNNVIMYYVYARSVATTTEITNAELIEDLENLYNAKSKSGTTNISTESENLPVVLSVSALKDED